MSGTDVTAQPEAGQCTFTATDGRRCILNQWHKAPRKRRGHYVTYGDIGDAHGTMSFLRLRQDPANVTAGPAPQPPSRTRAEQAAPHAVTTGNAPVYAAGTARAGRAGLRITLFEAVKPAQSAATRPDRQDANTTGAPQ